MNHFEFLNAAETSDASDTTADTTNIIATTVATTAVVATVAATVAAAWAAVEVARAARHYRVAATSTSTVAADGE